MLISKYQFFINVLFFAKKKSTFVLFFSLLMIKAFPFSSPPGLHKLVTVQPMYSLFLYSLKCHSFFQSFILLAGITKKRTNLFFLMQWNASAFSAFVPFQNPCQGAGATAPSGTLSAFYGRLSFLQQLVFVSGMTTKQRATARFLSFFNPPPPSPPSHRKTVGFSRD